MKKSKRILALLLSFILCVSLLPAAALAEDGSDFGDAEESTEESTASEDPAAGEAPEEEAQPTEALPASDEMYWQAEEEAAEEIVEETVVSEAANSDIPDVICANEEEAGKYMRQQMKNRAATIEFGYEVLSVDPAVYKPQAQALAKAVLAAAKEHTGVCDEGDYIRWNYAGGSSISVSYSLDTSINVTTCTFTYKLSYHTTAEQEAYVTNRVNEIFSQLNIAGMQTDYEKIKAIYTWICSNVKYDGTHAGDSTYTLKHTAYAALANGTAVCQGYALLFYYMSLKAGIDARLIAGTGSSGRHGWNIVQLNGLYYNLDSTWDSNFGSNFSAYRFFLKCPDEFPTHTRDAEYTTDEFNVVYPMAETSYPAVVESGTCGDGLTWEYCLGGILNIRGAGAMADYEMQNNVSTAPWMASYRTKIKTVNIGNGVTHIGNFAFYRTATAAVTLPEGLESIGNSAFSCCSYLTAVTLPASLKSIGTNAFYYCRMTEMAIPAGVESIGNNAFAQCTSLTAFTVDENNSAYSDLNGVLFSKDRTVLVKYPAGNTATSYTVPNTVATVGHGAFSNASSLTQITIPRSVTRLDVWAFYQCTGLTELNIPESVTAVGSAAFTGCSSLATLTFWGDLPGTADAQMFEGLESVIVYYPIDGDNWDQHQEDYGGTDIVWAYFTPLLGDCNTDWLVDLKDLLVLKKAIADNDFSNIRQASADLYPDDSVNLKDLLTLKRQLAAG